VNACACVCVYECIQMYVWEYGPYICYQHSCLHSQSIYVSNVPAIYTTSNPALILRLFFKASFYDMFIPFASITWQFFRTVRSV
jgi:hypothetical protein